MIRFLLMFLLLPGAEFVASNIDEVEPFTMTTLGAQFSMAVTPNTTFQKPLPASHGATSKGAMTNPPQSKESKSQPGLLKDSPDKPVRIQPVQRDPTLSEGNATHHQQRTPTHRGTKVAVTSKSHLLDESTLERPVTRKGPTPPNKAKTVVKPNPSSRYQSLPHLHHKNITSNPETGQLKDSNVTTGSKPQRTVMTPLRNAFKPGQKGGPFPSDKVKHFPVALQRALQLGMQLKEKTSNTSQLLNTLINQNSNFTNSIQQMARSSNSTFTTVKKSVPRQLNSLHSQDQRRNFENATSVPNVNEHNDVSRSGIFGRAHVPVEHDSRVVQELKSKVKVRIPERNSIYNHTNLNLRDAIFSTEPARLVQEETRHHQPESTTQVSVGRTTQLNTSATWTDRTLTKVTNLNNYPHGHIDAETEGYTQVMTRVGAHLHKEKNQANLAIVESQQAARNQTRSHKHRHTVLDQLHGETNTISQHNATLFDRIASSQPHRHHPKHLHNSTHPHSHSHHKHRSDHHHPQRNHISEIPIHQNIQEKPDVATEMQLSQSSPPQFYVDSLKSIQIKPSTKSSTHSHPMLLRPSFYLEALQDNQSYTQSVLHSQSELTTQGHEHTTLYQVSVTDSPTAIHKLRNMEQDAQSKAYQSPHFEPSTHEHSTSHTKFSLTQTAGHSMTTNFKQVLTTQPQLGLTTLINPEKKTQGQSDIHPTHEELTTPMQKQQTVKSQLDIAFWSLSKLTTPTKPGPSFQTQPEIITQTLSDLGKVMEISTPAQPEWSEQDFSARERSVWSTHRLPDSTKNSLATVTATTPFLVTQSQSEPTTERPTDLVKPAYVNATQTEDFIDGFNNKKPNTEPVTDTYTVQTTNSPMDLSPRRELQGKGTMDSTNETEEMRNSEIKYPAQEEPILKLQKNSTQTESRIESFSQTKPNTASKTATTRSINMSTTSKEPVTEGRDASNRTPLTTKSFESTTSTELVTEEGDTSNRTSSTTKSHTESSQIEATTLYSTHITTKTERTTRHDSVSNTQKNPAVPYSSDVVTQTSTTTHGADKIGQTSETELMFKTSLRATIHHHLETITHKELLQSIQPDDGTPTYPQQSMWTMPELIKNSDKDRDTETYRSMEQTSMPVNTRATEGSRTTWTVGYDGYSQNGSDNSRAIPAWGVQTFHPTSALPSGFRHSADPATTVKIYRPEAPSFTRSVTSPPSSTSTLQTLGELMSVQPGRDRIFIVEEQPPLFKVTTINVTHRVDVTQSVTCDQPDKCRNRFMEEVTSAYMAAPGFDRTDILNVTLAGGYLEYKVSFGVRLGSPLTSEQELLLTDPTSLFKSLAPSGEIPLLSEVRNASLTDAPVDPCADWFSCPRGFHCVPQRQLSALCLSPCHSAFCQNDGICIHRRGQDPVCQCPVGADFWYMGPTCDYRMTHHRLAAIACAVVFCIIICAAATVFILVRRFQTQILQQKVAQTQSSYRRFSRFDDVPTHFWCPSQTWLTTSASLNSLDNPAFSSSEEVFPLQALGSCVCGCQNATRSNPGTNPPEPPSRAPPRLETSCSSVNDLMIDSGKASDVSVCSWPMEPIHWTPFPILHQLSLQSPFHARRPHSYFEGMELVNTERSWTA